MPGGGESAKSVAYEEAEAKDAADWRPEVERETGRNADGWAELARRMPGGGDPGFGEALGTEILELGRERELEERLAGVEEGRGREC